LQLNHFTVEGVQDEEEVDEELIWCLQLLSEVIHGICIFLLSIIVQAGLTLGLYIDVGSSFPRKGVVRKNAMLMKAPRASAEGRVLTPPPHKIES
jgi:hypothetical protein